MATTKSTVVGIRLDHERRAWVEAEAARLGVSVRGLFEGMIDEARTEGRAEASRAIAGLGSAAPQASGVHRPRRPCRPRRRNSPGRWGARECTADFVPRPVVFVALVRRRRRDRSSHGSCPLSLLPHRQSHRVEWPAATNRLERCVLTRRWGRSLPVNTVTNTLRGCGPSVAERLLLICSRGTPVAVFRRVLRSSVVMATARRAVPASEPVCFVSRCDARPRVSVPAGPSEGTATEFLRLDQTF